MDLPTSGVYTFGSFQLDVGNRALTRDGVEVALPPRVFDTLVCLSAHPGTLLEKEALLEAVWPGRVVEENNLNQAISALRRTLAEDPAGARWILTVPGRGYRFLAPVDRIQPRAAKGSPVIDARAPSRGRLLAGVGLVALIALGIWRLATHPAPAPARPRKVAILPFRPLVPGTREPSLELGIAETLIGRLAGTGLAVLPLSAVRRYDGIDQDPRQAGRQLGVDSVLDATLQRWGDRIRVTARLIEVADGQARWSISVDERFTDLFTVEDAIARRVAESLAPQLSGEQLRELGHRETRSIDAYQAYLTGHYHLAAVTEASLRKSIELFEQAILLDPGYARAHAGVAEAYRRLGIASEVRPAEVFPRAEASAKRALELDPSLAEPHVSLGYIRFWYDWRWDEADAEFGRAIALDPQSAFPHLGRGQLLATRGRIAEALPEMTRARELEPLSLIINTMEAWFLSAAGREDEALRRVQRTLDIEPHFWVAHWLRGSMALAKGESAAALSELAEAHALARTPQTLAALGHAQARLGDRASGESALAELEARARVGYVPATALAKVQAGLGRTDAAFASLERACRERDGRLTFLLLDREWDELRADPRFSALRTRMHLD